MGQENSIVSDDTPARTLSDRSLDAVAGYIKSGQCKRIVVMTGAGISTAAGIPDFRSPNTGLYANLARLNLPYAEAVFDISYFRQHPEPFYVLAQELYPGKFHPTVAHTFIALLAAKGLLFHLFTQNIDCLERVAGVPGDLIVEAHGSFATQRCIECGTPFPDDKMKAHVAAGEVPRCEQDGCKGLMKPDIVFFGEQLPQAFRDKQYYPVMGDLALIMGTSLSVHPFAGLPETVRAEVPRVLFNLEQVGGIGSRADDVVVLGDCDAGVRKLADKLGWRDELESEWRRIVGDEEAERQLKGAKKRETILEDEVAKLAGEIEDVLNLADTDEVHSSQGTTDQVAGGETRSTEEVRSTAGVSSTKTGEDEPPKEDELVEATKEDAVRPGGTDAEDKDPILAPSDTKTADSGSTGGQVVSVAGKSRETELHVPDNTQKEADGKTPTTKVEAARETDSMNSMGAKSAL